MQSSGLVLWLVAVACACEPCQASSSGSSHQRPRNPLLAVVRAAKALHHHPPAAQPPPSLLPLLPSSALLEYPHLSRRHHAGPDLPQGALFPAQHRRRSPAGLQHLQRQQSAGGDDLQPPLEVQDLPDDERGEAEERRRTWSKRGQLSDAPVSGGAGDGQEEAVAAGLQQVGASIATNFLRHARSGPRPYDVPRIGECSLSSFLSLPSSLALRHPILSSTLPSRSAVHQPRHFPVSGFHHGFTIPPLSNIHLSIAEHFSFPPSSSLPLHITCPFPVSFTSPFLSPDLSILSFSVSPVICLVLHSSSNNKSIDTYTRQIWDTCTTTVFQAAVNGDEAKNRTNAKLAMGWGRGGGINIFSHDSLTPLCPFPSPHSFPLRPLFPLSFFLQNPFVSLLFLATFCFAPFSLSFLSSSLLLSSLPSPPLPTFLPHFLLLSPFPFLPLPFPSLPLPSSTPLPFSPPPLFLLPLSRLPFFPSPFSLLPPLPLSPFLLPPFSPPLSPSPFSPPFPSSPNFSILSPFPSSLPFPPLPLPPLPPHMTASTS
ncbi:hypothetical protein C7M84_006932 [Penaeus vannamei]|uniref:Uncharacterized protein n=1 Tax=Penaeus vannamei TaxID=6689 RepID=A0A423TDX3_PENVA|nr:hypothetical protein C7M84_006932 [Penaeus vannamei]